MPGIRGNDAVASEEAPFSEPVELFVLVGGGMDGVGLVFQHEVSVFGETPAPSTVWALSEHLSQGHAPPRAWHSHSLSRTDMGHLIQNPSNHCGLMATPLPANQSEGGWLLFFRKEQAENQRWLVPFDWQLYARVGERSTGNLGDAPIWQVTRAGQSREWTLLERRAAQDIVEDLSVMASAHAIRSLNEQLDRERRALALANEELEVLASTDALTQVCNRRRIEELLVQQISTAERYQHPISILMLDIDHFKRINDTYGHAVGDQALKSIAYRIRHSLRSSDHLGRWGGEEFLVLVPHTDGESALRFAERLRKNIAGMTLPIIGKLSVRIGVVQWLPGLSASALHRLADQGMYQAKEAGRNRSVYVEQ